MKQGVGARRAPMYDRSRLRQSIVHIGVGGFHRAHLATYVHELCAAGNNDWAIVGAGIMPADSAMAEALRAQDMAYHLIVRGAEKTSVTAIGSMVDYVLAADDLQPLIDRIALPSTQIVSLTITEGGYPIDDVTGDYSPEAPTAGPHSAFAAIAAALDQRRQTHGSPLTVLSCDNILANGLAAKTATLGAAAGRGPDLVEWIEANIAFPNSMVDRITPATVDADREWLLDEYGIVDRWPVVTEPFIQWVVEDNFAGDRLPLEDLDVIVTTDVEPYEQMKLRLLNAGHSCIAYLAALEGIDTVDKALATPHLRRYLEYFLRIEAQPFVADVPGIDLDEYVSSLLERFSNPSIGDQISRLCLDGSAKFPKFLLPTVDAALRTYARIDAAALALAGWCEYLGGKDELGRPIAHADDPNLSEAIAHAHLSRTDPAAFLDFAQVFSPSLRDDERFRRAFVTALDAIRSAGVRSAIAETIPSDD